MDFEALSINELNDFIRAKSDEREALIVEIRAACRVRDAKQAQARAKERLAAMTDVEKAALIQLVQAEAVASGEEVVGPGSVTEN
jgi:hypothetical protein